MQHILENFWKQNTGLPAERNPDTWNEAIEWLYKQGIGMEETVRYLYSEQPSFDKFNNWLQQQLEQRQFPDEAPLSGNVLSEEDLDSWNSNGYVVIRQAISPQQCSDTRAAIWAHLGMSPDNRASWYQPHEDLRGLMLHFADHDTLRKNRASARIRKAYEQLYGTAAIHKTIDKVSFNPPENNAFRFKGSPLHWDVSLAQPIPFALQGLLYLTDCGPHDGAFHCVPGFHNKIGAWLENLPPDTDPRQAILQETLPVAVPAAAGDFIIWQNTLPHCATANTGSSPRMVQYLTYLPDGYAPHKDWL